MSKENPMSSLITQMLKEFFSKPSVDEQLSALSKSLDEGYSDYSDLKSPELTREFAQSIGLHLDFKKSLKEDKEDFFIKNYKIIKMLRWVFILMFFMQLTAFIMAGTFNFSQIFPLFSMIFCFFTFLKAFYRMRNSYYQGKIRIFLTEKKIEGKELHSYLSKFYIYKKTGNNENISEPASEKEVVEESVKRKRL